MSWIKSHKQLLNHWKVAELMSSLGWDLDTAIGKLHRFWWWCVDYAEDGDLRKHNDNRLAAAAGVLPGDPAKVFVQAMVTACWLDRDPYFRVHAWWEHNGAFLQGRYKQQPEKWKAIRDLYAESEDSDTETGLSPDEVQTNSRTEKREKRDKRDRKPPQVVSDFPKALDDPLFREAWAEWEKHRRSSPHKLTEQGAAMSLKKCERWGVTRSVAAIEHSIASGYRGIFEDRADARAKPTATVLSTAEWKAKPYSPHGN